MRYHHPQVTQRLPKYNTLWTSQLQPVQPSKASPLQSAHQHAPISPASTVAQFGPASEPWICASRKRSIRKHFLYIPIYCESIQHYRRPRHSPSLRILKTIARGESLDNVDFSHKYITMENPQSFTARRSAASNLPTFQLPPPDLSNMHKFPTLSSINTSQPTASNPHSVLTPPVGVPGDGMSPLSSSVNSGSSQSSTAGVAPYNPLGGSNFWQQPSSSYTFSTAAPQMPSPFAAQNSMGYMGRQLYSPSMNYSSRNGASPNASEALPPPPYDLNLPPFPTSMPMSGSGAGSSNLPTLAPQQQHQQQHHQQQHSHQHQHQQQHQQQQQMSSMMNSQNSNQNSQAPSLQHSDSYGSRQNYSYAPTSTPQQSNFPAYALPSPTSQSSMHSGQNDRISPVSANQSSYSRPYGNYSLPAMAGPIMSNVHSPGGQMALVGGMNMNGYPSHMHHMYGGGHPSQQQPQNDRPFKCDQCPQSFNRNHDLKRHKRIHLAVKPFPCGHCEKSFSRKDALKVRNCSRKPPSKCMGSMTE